MFGISSVDEKKGHQRVRRLHWCRNVYRARPTSSSSFFFFPLCVLTVTRSSVTHHVDWKTRPMASVLPFVRGVDFSRNEFPVSSGSSWPVVHRQSFLSTIQNGRFSPKVTEMSNLRWLRLKWSNLSQLPKEIDQFKKLVGPWGFFVVCT